MTVTLSPPMFLQFFNPNNSGAPAAGFKLFTYIAGTSTKQATWTDSTQTVQNPNPYILDSNGIGTFWGDPTLAYKFVFAQPNDTDPPTSPLRTVDNLYFPLTAGGLTQQVLGLILYPQTAAESGVSVTPTNFGYPPGDVRRYGAVGNGSTSDTTALVNALKVQQDVFIPGGFNCATTTGLTMLSNQTIYGVGFDSQITCTSANTNALILTGQIRSVVRDLFVKYVATTFSTGTDSAAVFIGTGASYCTVRNCRLEGTRAGVTINYADRSTVTDNLISSADGADVCWDIGVYLGGTHNLISRNRCEGGAPATSTIATTGVLILSDNTHGCDWNIVANNDVGTHSQYGILLYANTPGGTTQHSTVVGNIVHDITGTYNSGSGLGYGAGIYVASAEWTTVVGNFIYNTNVSTAVQILAPGGIGILNVSCFTIVGNVIRAPVWYGIFVATDGNLSGGGLIEGNVVTSPGKDGIGLSSIGYVSVQGNSVSGATNNGISYTNTAPGAAISIQNNKIFNCTQTGMVVTQLDGPNISGNYVGNCANGLNMTHTSGGFVVSNEFRSNVSNDVVADSSNSGYIHFDRNTVRSGATNGVNDSFGFTYGINDVAGQTNTYTGTVGYERVLATSATPSVAGSLSASYGGATAITDFVNGYIGQRLTVRATASITLSNNAGAATTKLIMRAGANLSLTSGQTATFELVPGGPWYQV